MRKNDNIEIVQRMLEIGKNDLDYSVFPKPFKEEHIFLSNVLSDALRKEETDFNEDFKKAVGEYKRNLKEKGWGWFYAPEKLIWSNTIINQLKYVIYGDRFIREYKFNETLGKGAYKDLINQIDRTALMSERQKKALNKRTSKLAMDILNELLEEEKKDLQVK